MSSVNPLEGSASVDLEWRGAGQGTASDTSEGWVSCDRLTVTVQHRLPIYNLEL